MLQVVLAQVVQGPLRLSRGKVDLHLMIGQQRGATDWLLPLLETYPEEARGTYTVLKPKEDGAAVFLHPGERVFDRLCSLIETRFRQVAMAGSVFSDPWADAPYFVHVARVQVVRGVFRGEPGKANRREPLDCRLVAVKLIPREGS